MLPQFRHLLLFLFLLALVPPEPLFHFVLPPFTLTPYLPSKPLLIQIISRNIMIFAHIFECFSFIFFTFVTICTVWWISPANCISLHQIGLFYFYLLMIICIRVFINSGVLFVQAKVLIGALELLWVLGWSLGNQWRGPGLR